LNPSVNLSHWKLKKTIRVITTGQERDADLTTDILK
jgi:hypothetical protein